MKQQFPEGSDRLLTQSNRVVLNQARNVMNKSHGHMLNYNRQVLEERNNTELIETGDSGEVITMVDNKYVIKDAKSGNQLSKYGDSFDQFEKGVQMQADTDTQTYRGSGSPIINAELRNIQVYKFQ